MTLFVTGGSPAPGANGDAGGKSGVPADLFDGATPVMWQIHNTYILAETRTGLVMVDQHSAHERVLYEEIVRGFDAGVGAESQRLLFPLTLRLSPAEYALVEQIRGGRSSCTPSPTRTRTSTRSAACARWWRS
jgi:DNA mismatch repair protein MutL